ncbi:IreB family regulatory phosphoprotein [Mollicutes bacterium LVI A0039]|nr:IreB family regulatory phosphoprotein [Mollicutes bacterium LVI A0039]
MDSGTIEIKIQNNTGMSTREILQQVVDSMEEKGYNAKEQIAGYIISGDPSYIPRNGSARNLIRQIPREEILAELIESFLK